MNLSLGPLLVMVEEEQSFFFFWEVGGDILLYLEDLGLEVAFFFGRNRLLECWFTLY